MDGTLNQVGGISRVVNMVVDYKGHSECIQLAVLQLSKQHVILGYSWFQKHNPEINWETKEVYMTRCLTSYCTCRDELQAAVSSDVRDGSSITGFYITGSSFRVRPTLSPFPKRPLASRTRSRAIVSRIRWFPGFTLTSFLRRKAVYTSPTIETDALLDMDNTLDTPRYNRSPPVAERVADPFCCRFHTTSRAGRTLPVPDADPADEAELIPTPPPPPLHTTHRLAEGDRSSLPLPERSSAFRCDHQAVPEALVVF
ncbi:hypothetical protein B0H14DRAFT_3426238 [Mycena olivaceomarginata]|nr:hypothetical protein B0H14DRAFT_3426238 [Mycena olivaceomarginata]